MTYLGNAPNVGGFMFMKAPNNVIFYTTHCIFDESIFPRCNKVVKKPLTRLLEVPHTHHHHQDTIPVDEEDTPQDIAEMSQGVLESSPLKKG
jgi:hypothetical protein